MIGKESISANSLSVSMTALHSADKPDRYLLNGCVNKPCENTNRDCTWNLLLRHVFMCKNYK